jgi:uncharacterized protein YndB with AHSA1/START domain
MQDDSLTIVRTYKGSLPEIWDLWTTQEGFESWWGPQGFRADVHAIDARSGGELRYDMVAATDEMIAAMAAMGEPASHATRATFSAVEPQARIVMTNVIDFLAGVPPYTSEITVEFVAGASTVTMTVTLPPMHDATFTKMQLEGFTSQLTKLDDRLA